MPYWIDLVVQQMRTFNGLQKDFLSNKEEINFWIGSMYGGNCCRFLNRCERITYNTLVVTIGCLPVRFQGRCGVLM
jgi:hypothetical protein